MKRMHESLNDCSERTRANTVYHTSPVIEQWEGQKNQSEELKEFEHGQYHQRQEYQHQSVVPILGDQTSPKTS